MGSSQAVHKFAYLDSLRGLAAFVVVLTHFAGMFFPFVLDGTSQTHSRAEHLLYGTPLGIFFSGHFSVLLFFVLSGFVLTYKFFRTGDSNIIRRSATKRYLRLMPIVAVSVLAAFLLLKLNLFTNLSIVPITHSAWIARLWTFPPHFHDALYQAFFGVFIPGVNSYNSLLWTMQIEFLGSFMVFSAVLMFGHLSVRWIAWAVLLLIFGQTSYLGFLLGMILADIFVNYGHRIKQLPHINILALMLLCVGLYFGAFPSDGPVMQTIYGNFHWFGSGDYTNFLIWHAFAAVCLISALLLATPLQKALSHKSLLRLGRMSFALYAVHLFILCSVGSYVFMQAYRWSSSYTAGFLISFEITLLLILLVSAIVTKFIDQPAIIFANNPSSVLIRIREMPLVLARRFRPTTAGAWLRKALSSFT